MDTRRSSQLLLVVIYFGFFSLGLPDGSFGVAWPAMHPELKLPIGIAGTITTVVTLLSALSGFAGGAVIARFRTGPVALVSCALTGSALVAVSQARGAAWLFVAAVPLGLGAGAVDTGLNGFVARHYSARHMNWLHACWGGGALCGPLIMGSALAGAGGWRDGYRLIGAAQLTLAVVFLLSLRFWRSVPELSPAETPEGNSGRRPTLLAGSLAGWLSAGLFVLYAAVEGTLGVWAGSILVSGRGFSATTAAMATATYFGAITLGRVLIGFVVNRWGNRRLVNAGVGLALIGCVIFAVSVSPGLAAVALLLTGLGFAPIYPCLMHEVPNRFAPEAAPVVIGRQSGAAYLGAAFLPAAAGLLAAHSITGIPWLVAGGIVALIVGIRTLDRMS